MLQRQLLEVRKEKEQELQQRNEAIAHLKDQLQETKAKTNMEGGENIDSICILFVKESPHWLMLWVDYFRQKTVRS